ncbi:MAG: Alkane 1-monooxygenase [Pseudomonadota bacterium]|jgi:fatty acid desaturase
MVNAPGAVLSSIPGTQDLRANRQIRPIGGRVLRYAADTRTLAFIAVWFAVETFAWVRPWEWSWLSVALLGLCSVGSFFGAVASHNAVHTPVFRSRALETAWRSVLSVVYGHPASAFVPVHNLSHHRHLESQQDVMRTSKTLGGWHLFNLFTFAPRISGALWAAELSYVRHAWQRRPRWRRALLIEATVLSLVLLTLALIDWRKLVVFVLIPHAYAAWGVVTMNLLQHHGADTTSHYNHSRNFTGALVNWFTFNNGFHTVHHHRPTLHWSLAPQAHAQWVKPHIDLRLDEASLLSYLWRAFVFPALRVRFDGAPVVTGDTRPDLRWYGEQGNARAQRAEAHG